MKFPKGKKHIRSAGMSDRLTQKAVPSPYFTKQFAGFVYVKRRSIKLRPGEHGVF